MNVQKLLARTNLLNWGLVILGGWCLTFYYTIIKGWLSLYGSVLVRVFANVTDKEGKLYLLYLGDFIAGAIGAILTAFLTVFLLGIFFQERPFMFGVITGLVGLPLIILAFIISSDPFSGIWLRRPGFLIGEIMNWVILVACCGIAGNLGYKTQGRFLKWWEKPNSESE